MRIPLAILGALIGLALFLMTREQTKTFDFEDLSRRAAALAARPHQPAPSTVPKFIQDLNYDQHRDIRFKEDFTLWRSEGLPFQIRFFHPGGVHKNSVKIHELSSSGIQEVPFSADRFDYGKNQLPPDKPVPATTGYAGFRVHYPLNRADYLDEVCAFLGASYFRGVGRGLSYGLSARGLALDTLPRKKGAEEFPVFREFWLQQPESGSGLLTVLALMDSPSVAGAYRFNIIPGDETVINVKARIYPRRELKDYGIAPLTSMFWFGENTGSSFGDYRPEVHDSDGLLMETGTGEFLWRPLSHTKNLQVNTFEDDTPRGFGLLQRDRVFNNYQDMEANYHQRPSAWVQPLGQWGKGHMTLMQLTTNNEFMDNVVAYWTPSTPASPGIPFGFEYNLYFFGENDSRPLLGRTQATRVDWSQAKSDREVVFVLDFEGRQLASIPADEPPQADLRVGKGGRAAEVQVQKNEANHTWRVILRVALEEWQKPVELSCRLLKGDKPLTETWTYTWSL
jgi:glucans biosynthesis protein